MNYKCNDCGFFEYCEHAAIIHSTIFCHYVSKTEKELLRVNGTDPSTSITNESDRVTEEYEKIGISIKPSINVSRNYNEKQDKTENKYQLIDLSKALSNLNVNK